MSSTTIERLTSCSRGELSRSTIVNMDRPAAAFCAPNVRTQRQNCELSLTLETMPDQRQTSWLVHHSSGASSPAQDHIALDRQGNSRSGSAANTLQDIRLSREAKRMSLTAENCPRRYWAPSALAARPRPVAAVMRAVTAIGLSPIGTCPQPGSVVR
ncbi:MAG: hypothetical protein ACJ8AG_09550 [Ktedonobacteraceae bacterium]